MTVVLLSEDESLLLNRALTPIFGVLVEDFVGTRHAELVARALLDRLGAGLEVAHLGGERGVTHLERGIPAFPRGYLPVEVPGAQPPALAKPERVLDEEDERGKDDAEHSHRARA